MLHANLRGSYYTGYETKKQDSSLFLPRSSSGSKPFEQNREQLRNHSLVQKHT